MRLTLEHSLLARYYDVDAKIFVIQERIKLKENALEASSKMFIEKEKELNNRIEELETKLNKTSLNALEVKKTETNCILTTFKTRT